MFVAAVAVAVVSVVVVVGGGGGGGGGSGGGGGGGGVKSNVGPFSSTVNGGHFGHQQMRCVDPNTQHLGTSTTESLFLKKALVLIVISKTNCLYKHNVSIPCTICSIRQVTPRCISSYSPFVSSTSPVPCSVGLGGDPRFDSWSAATVLWTCVGQISSIRRNWTVATGPLFGAAVLPVESRYKPTVRG